MKDADLFKNVDDQTANKLRNFLDNIDNLLGEFSQDKDIVEILEKIKRYPAYYIKAIYPCYSGNSLDKHLDEYIIMRLNNELFHYFLLSHSTIFDIVPPEYSDGYRNLSKKILTQNVQHPFYYTYYEVKQFLLEYTTYKKIIIGLAEELIKKCVELYCLEMEKLLYPYYNLKYYNRFKKKYEDMISSGKKEIYDFFNSDRFLSLGNSYASIIADKVLKNFSNKLFDLDQDIQIFIEYYNKRLLNLKEVMPKNISNMEKEMYEDLTRTTDKEDFDRKYSTAYKWYIDVKNINQSYKDNLKTKRNINVIKRKIDYRYMVCTKSMNEEEFVVANRIKDYLYDVIEKIITNDNISFNMDAISGLKFNDLEHDVKLINGAINGINNCPNNSIYLINFSIMYLDRYFSSPFVELKFNEKNISVNEITKYDKQDGFPYINYDNFIYEYMPLEVYINNSIYYGKYFIINDLHNEDSQDFSKSKLLLNYNGILLIETDGEYEIVSHETIIRAGYDIPKYSVPKRSDKNFIESNKKIILSNILSLAEKYREEEYTLIKSM